jgi:hypothetical protein
MKYAIGLLSIVAFLSIGCGSAPPKEDALELYLRQYADQLSFDNTRKLEEHAKHLQHIEEVLGQIVNTLKVMTAAPEETEEASNE